MSRTHRGTANITISDDQDTEYSLSVSYSVTAGCPATYSAWHGWSPPEGPELEIEETLCTCVTFNNSIARPPRTIEIGIEGDKQSQVGAWCLETWEDEIREKCFEDANEAELAGREE